MSDDLVEDEFTNRPEDDELAFLHYERLFRRPLDEALAKLQDESRDGYWDSYNHFMQTYINHVLNMTKALNLDILDYWANDRRAASDSQNFQHIKYDIDGAIISIKVRHAQVIKRNSVHLASNTREKIRELINKIKLTIEGIELPLPRKESLMNKLNAFAAEVDRDRTRFEAFGALVIEVANVAGKAERKLRPIRRWIESIAGVMHEASAVEDARPRLPPPAKRIAPPSKLSAPPQAPKTGGDGLDDEIPF